MYAAPSRFKRSGAIRTEKKRLLEKYEEKLNKKEQELTLLWVLECRFHYLCITVLGSEGGQLP